MIKTIHIFVCLPLHWDLRTNFVWAATEYWAKQSYFDFCDADSVLGYDAHPDGNYEEQFSSFAHRYLQEKA